MAKQKNTETEDVGCTGIAGEALLRIAQAELASNPNLTEAFVTIDGLIFHDIAQAEDHVKNLTDKTIINAKQTNNE